MISERCDEFKKCKWFDTCERFDKSDRFDKYGIYIKFEKFDIQHDAKKIWLKFEKFEICQQIYRFDIYYTLTSWIDFKKSVFLKRGS